MKVRLHKVIAASGLTSRRQAESLIKAGQVTVNGRVVQTLGSSVDPASDHVKVNGRHLKPAAPEVFLLLHKPPGYVTTMKDPLGRPTIANLLEQVSLRVFPVGRLDYDAEGLLLLTNNGQIAQACLHPRYHVPKTYLVKVSGVLSGEEIHALQRGIQLEDGPTAPAMVKKAGIARVNSWIEVTIYEGRKHQIKRMVEALGHRVVRLKRTRFGPLSLGDLRAGSYRYLTDSEANALREVFHRYSPPPSKSKNSLRNDLKNPMGGVETHRFFKKGSIPFKGQARPQALPPRRKGRHSQAQRGRQTRV